MFFFNLPISGLQLQHVNICPTHSAEKQHSHTLNTNFVVVVVVYIFIFNFFFYTRAFQPPKKKDIKKVTRNINLSE